MTTKHIEVYMSGNAAGLASGVAHIVDQISTDIYNHVEDKDQAELAVSEFIREIAQLALLMHSSRFKNTSDFTSDVTALLKTLDDFKNSPMHPDNQPKFS